MATLKFYLDKRSRRKDNTMPLKIGISNKNEYALINIDVALLPEQWDDVSGKIINHSNKLFLNNYIKKRLIDVETIILRLTESGEIRNMAIRDIKQYISKTLSPIDEEESPLLFADRIRLFANDKINPRTKEIYLCTLSRIEAFTDIDKLSFEDITINWLKSFEKFLSITSPSQNARNVHLRNIRAVFNAAIDDELITCYPFRRFKIKGKETPKRSLLADQLCTLRDYNCEDHQKKYRDMFMLIFYLVGINMIDLCNLKHKSIVNGRLEYYRAKTGKFYSIKIEPEIAELLEKYRGEDWLVNILDNYKNYKDYAKKINDNVREIGETKWVEKKIKGKKRKIKERKPIFPNVTTYWARHTWATIAASLDIPKETISAALGHEIGSRITSIYIDFNQNKIDDANRKVIDYINNL